MNNKHIGSLVQLVAARPELKKRLEAVRGLQGERTTRVASPFLPPMVEKALVDYGAIGRRERDNTHVVHITDQELDWVLEAAGKIPPGQAMQAVEQKEENPVRSKAEPAKTAEPCTPWQRPQLDLTEEEERVREQLDELNALLDALYPSTPSGRHLVPELETLLAKLITMVGGMSGASGGEGVPGCLLPIRHTYTGANKFAADLRQALEDANSAFNEAVSGGNPPGNRKDKQRYQRALTLIRQNLAGAEPVAAK